jgi:outer membrane protein TolC
MANKKLISIIMACIVITDLSVSAKILSLSEAENIAITTGFEARMKYFEEQMEEWKKLGVVANYFPTIDYNMNYTRLDDSTVYYSNLAMNFIEDSPMLQGLDVDLKANKMYQNTITNEVSLTQPLYNGGMEISAIKIAYNVKKAFKLQQKAFYQDDIYNTRKAYFDALAAIERTKVARQTLSWTQQNFQNSKIKYKAGGTPITDMLQWEAEVLQKESELLEATATEEFMMMTLLQTIGVPPAKSSILIDLQPLEIFKHWYKRGMVNTGDSIVSNYQLQTIKLYTKIAEENKRMALGSFLPKLNAFCKYSRDHGWEYFDLGKMFDNSDYIIQKPKNFATGISLSIPLFHGFRKSIKYKKTNYEYLKIATEEKKVESQLKVNLNRIKLFYKASYQSVKAAQKQVELMEKQLEIMQKRYDGGLVNQSQLLEVSLGTNQTKIGYIQKLFECLLYEAEYLKNVGKLEVAQ